MQGDSNQNSGVNEATEKKGFLSGIDFKNPKTILAIVGIAITVIGIIIGLCVWLSRKSKKEKAKQEQAEFNQQLKNISVSQSTSVSTGNLAEKVHTSMSAQNQQQSNDTFSQYSKSSINNTQQPLSLNDSRRSNDIGR